MSGKFEMVVGLEVHCQLGTKTKLFCPCGTDGFGQPANTRICPVCTGQPGVLPVLNRAAVELAFQAALALGCRLAPQSIFARKNYFYPDLPKAYQISQYEEPFSKGGQVELPPKDGAARSVRLHRIHLEEDAGKLLHAIGSQELDCSLADFNRAGVPLIEIVSEPDMRSSEEAYAYLNSLKEVLQYVGVSRCDMEKGEMRCDANVSVRPRGQDKLGVKVEIKNLNSFRAVRDALDHEFSRQVRAVEAGEAIVQETRLWDAQAQRTEPMRSKEEAHDYRYFPDPDLVPLSADPKWVSQLESRLPELPAARRARLAAQYGLSSYDAEVLASDRALGDYFEAAVKSPSAPQAKPAANMIMTELLGRLNAEGRSIEDCSVPPERLGELVSLVQGGKLSGPGAKKVFAGMWETGKAPQALVEELGLSQVSDDSQLSDWVKQAIAANPRAAADVRSGKERAVGAIVGAVMKLSKGKANPGRVNELIKEALK